MNRLQQLRETATLSRADLARRSDVTQSVIEQLEAGVHLNEAERAVEVPGETPVEDIAVILTKLADALSANLIEKNISVSPDELLEPARDDLPAKAEAETDTQSGEETLPALPLVGVNYAPSQGALPPDARSHNETETPDDIDAALDQLALNSQITASEEAAETGADEVTPLATGPDTPVSPAAETGANTAPDFTEPSSTGLIPTGGTETINMAELPDTLPIGVLPGSPPVVETREVSPLADQPTGQSGEADREFASQETQEIYIPPEVRASLPGYGTASEGVGEIRPATPVHPEAMSDAPTQQFEISAVRPQPDKQPVMDTTELEKAEQPPDLATADEPSSVVMAETAASPDVYEAVPEPEMPGPAPAPETMEASSEAHPEPPDMVEVEKEDQAAYTPPANLGLETAHDVAEVPPNRTAPLIPPVQPTPLELEATTPVQDDAPLTKSEPEKQPEMQPYVMPGPSAEAQSRYKLPPSTLIPSIAGVVATLVWFAWRSWRRAKAESERVAPYYKKK